VKTPAVSRLFVYPIKSLSRTAVSESRIMPGGGLAHDREFALFDPDGTVINAKRHPRVHHIQANYDLSTFTITLSGRKFHLTDDRANLERWFSDYFGFPVTMKRNIRTGFPDDLECPGPTILSVASLAEVNAWFPDLELEGVGRRFRANIEIGNVPAFWEDRLFGEPDEVVEFKIGGVRFQGVNPCARCPVPSRDQDTAEVLADFQKIFSAKREATLPAWAALGRFDHFYRLSVNTRVPAEEAGKVIRVGDPVQEIRGLSY
jgi:uncharacterized protein YcbX